MNGQQIIIPNTFKKFPGDLAFCSKLNHLAADKYRTKATIDEQVNVNNPIILVFHWLTPVFHCTEFTSISWAFSFFRSSLNVGPSTCNQTQQTFIYLFILDQTDTKKLFCHRGVGRGDNRRSTVVVYGQHHSYDLL